MKNDLSNLKVGDWVWTIPDGWVQISRVNKGEGHPILVMCRGMEYWYTLDGRYHLRDKHPSAFHEPPEAFNAEPKPVQKVKKWKWVYSSELLRGDEVTHYYLTKVEFEASHLTETDNYMKIPWTEIEVEV